VKQDVASTDAEVIAAAKSEEKAVDDAATQMAEAHARAARMAQQSWEAVMKPIENQFASAITSMANSTATFQTAMRKMMSNITTQIFESSIKTMINNWATGQHQMTALSELWAKMTVATHTTAAAQTGAIDSTTAKADIQTKGAQAMAGAYNAMVGIPYVGTVLAIAAMAAAESVVMGLVGRIASAEGGMVVDSDQMAMVHEDEMILPRHLSQGIQEKVLNQDSDRQDAAKNSGTTHMHITAHDPKSFADYIGKQSNRNSIVKSVQKAVRKGNRPTRATT
jgi:uncharacterized protein YhaN